MIPSTKFDLEHVMARLVGKSSTGPSDHLILLLEMTLDLSTG